MPADTEFTEFAAARSGPMFRTAWLLTGDWHFRPGVAGQDLPENGVDCAMVGTCGMRLAMTQ